MHTNDRRQLNCWNCDIRPTRRNAYFASRHLTAIHFADCYTIKNTARHFHDARQMPLVTRHKHPVAVMLSPTVKSSWQSVVVTFSAAHFIAVHDFCGFCRVNHSVPHSITSARCLTTATQNGRVNDVTHIAIWVTSLTAGQQLHACVNFTRFQFVAVIYLQRES